MNDEKKYHRIRHYPGRWSNFDLVEECKKPAPCMNCEFDHPLCSEHGKVLHPEKYKQELEREAARFGRR